jgi:hypothetical protein
VGHKDDNAFDGPEDQRGLRRLPAASAAARSNLLLGDAPPAGRRAAGHPRPVRVRPHGRPDRRRAAPAADARRAPRGAGRLGGGAAPRPGRRRLAAPGRGRAGRRRRAPRPAAVRARALHALDAGRLRARADLELGGAGHLHGRLGRLGRADHGAAAGRPRALPRRLRAPRPGVPARELRPRRARRLAHGPDLPAGAGGRRPAPRPGDAHTARRRRRGGRAGAGAVRRRRAGDRGRAGVGALRRPPRVRGLRPHPRPRRRGGRRRRAGVRLRDLPAIVAAGRR